MRGRTTAKARASPTTRGRRGLPPLSVHSHRGDEGLGRNLEVRLGRRHRFFPGNNKEGKGTGRGELVVLPHYGFESVVRGGLLLAAFCW